jgi:hypothetical protein
VKLEREVKQASEMANRMEKEAKSGQLKGDGSGIERASGPCEDCCLLNLAK